MNPSNQAAQLNNDAIAALQRGDTADAVQSLKHALALLMPLANEGQPPAAVAPASPGSIHSAPLLSLATTLSNTENDDEVFVMYPRPFVLSITPPMPGLVCIHQCMVVVLYNLAFAFDTLVLSKAGMPNLQSKVMGWRANAVKLYRLCLQVAGSRSRAEVDLMKCVLLAASNNLGHLSKAFDDTKNCLRMSLDLIGAGGLTDQISPDDYELLFSSLAPFLCVKEYLLPVAPAA